jgi:uncharacterized membrane protein
MKRGLIILACAAAIFFLPVLLGFLWGLHAAHKFVPRVAMTLAEIDQAKSVIVERWTGGGVIWGLILLVYAIAMRMLFWVVSGITSGLSRAFGKKRKKSSHTLDGICQPADGLTKPSK